MKELLLKGVRPEDIVVCYRSVKEDAALLAELFAATGIPFYHDSTLSLTELPLTKALISILQLEQEDWAYDRLMKLVDSNFFRPNWDLSTELLTSNSIQPSVAISTVIRKARLGEGRFSLLRKLNWLAENEPQPRPDVQKSAAQILYQQQIKVAADWLNKLSEIMAPLRKRHSFAEWIELIIFIARDLGLTSSTRNSGTVSEDNRPDLEASQWEFLEKTLFDAVRFCEQFQVAVQKISLTEFQSQLIHLLQRIPYPQTQREQGTVRILEASQIRNLEIDYLFLAGMTEGSFPQTRPEDCLYSETERLQFQEWGIPLGHSATRTQEEMLLFYSIITRARKKLFLSYPSVSSGGEPLFPAPYFQAVQELFTPEAAPLQHVGSLDPLPEPDSMLTFSDLRLVATQQVRQHKPALFAALFSQAVSTPAARTILTTAQMSQARFHTAGFTEYEGIVSNAHNLKLLQEHFTPDYQFSTRQLESFAECPFRFMYAELFQLRSLEPPEIRTDYQRRGIITHDILAALHRQYQDVEHESLSAEAVWVQELFQQLTTEKLVNLPSASDLEQVLLEVEQQLFQQWGDAFGEHWSSYAGEYLETWEERPTPRYVELPFGDVPTGEGKFEVLHESVQFGKSDQSTPSVRVRGRIDRIDVGEHQGKTHYSVIDFKTGNVKKVNLREICSGRKLQLAIYTLAVQRLGLLGEDALPFDLGYWLLNEKGFTRGITRHPQHLPKVLGQMIIDLLNEILDQLLPKLAAEIRTGSFPVYNEDLQCGQFCEFRTICRVGQIRSLPESLGKVVQIGIEDPTRSKQAEEEASS
ncbi:MAG: PD-(D/E)XK nuclease family protein [Planctomycetaceae bacterium]